MMVMMVVIMMRMRMTRMMVLMMMIFSAEFLRPLDSTWLPLNLVACCGCCGPLACCAGELGPNGVSGEHDVAGAAGRPRPRRPSPGPGSSVAAPLRSSLA